MWYVYGQLDIETVWATVISDIPDLHLKCQAIINSQLSWLCSLFSALCIFFLQKHYLLDKIK